VIDDDVYIVFVGLRLTWFQNDCVVVLFDWQPIEPAICTEIDGRVRNTFLINCYFNGVFPPSKQIIFLIGRK
jgi:hypothetical protein